MDQENFLPGLVDSDEQFSMSHELILLLQWLIEHDAERLKKLVDRAVTHGYAQHIQRIKNGDFQESLENAHDAVLLFFSALETMLIESLHEQSSSKTLVNNLLPALDLIDSMACDDAIVQESLEKVTTKIGNVQKTARQEILLREILKNWKPNKKQATQ